MHCCDMKAHTIFSSPGCEEVCIAEIIAAGEKRLSNPSITYRPLSAASTLDTLPIMGLSQSSDSLVGSDEDADSRGTWAESSPKAIDVRVPGEFSFVVLDSSYAQVLSSARRFFEEWVPAFASDSEEQICKVFATVFVDYIPVRMKVCIAADGENSVTVALRDTAQSDIVRSKRVGDRLVRYLKSSDLNCNKDHPLLVDDDFEFADDESYDQQEDKPQLSDPSASTVDMPLPGDIAIVLSAPLNDVISRTRQLLAEGVPAVTSWVQPQKVSATVFVDYVPVEIEICISAEGPGADSSTVALRHCSSSDIVRFKRVFECLVRFFESEGLHITAPQQSQMGAFSVATQLVDDVLDFTDEESVADESSWSERIELALGGVDAGSAEVREQTFRTLVHWAAFSPTSHVAMSHCLAKRASGIEQMFHAQSPAPVSETYPVAALLSSLACGQSLEAKDILSKSVFAKLSNKTPMVHLPWFVSAELAKASQGLQ